MLQYNSQYLKNMDYKYYLDKITASWLIKQRLEHFHVFFDTNDVQLGFKDNHYCVKLNGEIEMFETANEAINKFRELVNKNESL